MILTVAAAAAATATVTTTMAAAVGLFTMGLFRVRREGAAFVSFGLGFLS